MENPMNLTKKCPKCGSDNLDIKYNDRMERDRITCNSCGYFQRCTHYNPRVIYDKFNGIGNHYDSRRSP